jgi:hypothetical protein
MLYLFFVQNHALLHTTKFFGGELGARGDGFGSGRGMGDLPLAFLAQTDLDDFYVRDVPGGRIVGVQLAPISKARSY